jgi:hypothetical protein
MGSPRGEPPCRLLLELTVEIGDGRHGTVHVRTGDSADELAALFARAHSLDERVVAPLSVHIQQQVDSVLQGEEAVLPVAASGPAPRGGGARFSGPPRRSEPTFQPQINRCSRRTTQARRGGEGTTTAAFERLHQDAASTRDNARARSEHREVEHARKIAQKKVGMSGVSRALAASRSELNGARNYGEKLYQEGLMHQKQKVELLKEIRQQEEARRIQEQGLTFCPTISRYAASKQSAVFDDYRGHARTRKQARDLQHIRAEMALGDEVADTEVLGQAEQALGLTGSGAMRERLQRVWHAMDELQECTFQPVTSAASDALARKARQQQDTDTHRMVHDKLVEDGNRRREKVQEYESDAFNPDVATFRPDIGITKWRPRTDDNDADFLQRLVNEKKVREQQLQLVREEKSKPVDPATGAPLYQPHTRRRQRARGGAPRQQPPSPSGRGRRGEGIWEHLHASRHEYADLRRVLEAREDELLWEAANRCHRNQRSREAAAERERRQARRLFDALDVAGRGAIDRRQLSETAARLEPALAAEIAPAVLAALEDGGEAVGFERFLQIVGGLAAYKTTRLAEVLARRRLPPAGGGDEEGSLAGDKGPASRSAAGQRGCDAPRYAPELNPVSREIVTQLGRSGDLYERMRRERARQMDALEQRRCAKLAEELKECTFRPRINDDDGDDDDVDLQAAALEEEEEDPHRATRTYGHHRGSSLSYSRERLRAMKASLQA